MNNKHILDLTLRLSQALDQNYDVVNMETVVSVISALEGTTITKEQLEATRLAKYINQLRRRTNCENLARRSKSLLKRWREMVGIQQGNEISATAASVAGYANPSNVITTSTNTNTNTSFNMPVSDSVVSNSQLTNPQFSHQQHYPSQQYQSNAKQHQIQQQLPYRSEPSSPVNLQEKSNPNEFLISISNPATVSQVPKSSNSQTRKKRKLDKNLNRESNAPQQPTSFANLITGLGNTNTAAAAPRKTTRDKTEPVTSVAHPVETFIIEHSSNSNSDLICIPSNNIVSSNFTSATNVPPVVIDLQDTNSSMNSLVSKDVTNVSTSFYRNKSASKKSKKEKKRKDRNNTMLRQSHPLHDCDDQNTTNATYQNKQPSDVLLLDEKSHSACPTISNISEILSLSNSSMSSVFPSVDAMSKNMFQGQNEATSSLKMNKSELTFAGKFKQDASSTSTGGCNIINYNSDSINTNAVNSNSLNQGKFSMFGGIDTNSNGSSSSSRSLSLHDVAYGAKRETSNSLQNIEDDLIKHDVNEKSVSNMSIKGGNSSMDNAFALTTSAAAGAQSQQSIELNKEVSSQKVIKTPKKRGRKKGSKGVDSIIAKETSLSSQMLLTPLGVAGKKVKTTKELYAEMESRKFRNVKALAQGEQPANSATNWTNQQQINPQKPAAVSRCPSLSDIADSDSCTMTSEPSRDSGNLLNKAAKGKRETQLDNNSNYSKHDSEFKTKETKSVESSVAEITTQIRFEIQEIVKLLPPPASVKEIEYECFNSMTPCTCTIEEVTVPPENDTIGDGGNNDSQDSRLDDTHSTNINEKEETKQLQLPSGQTTNATESRQLAESGEGGKVEALPPAPVKVKKSIFDLDFDDDDDPLNSIIADIEGKNFKAEDVEVKSLTQEAAVNEKFELPLKTEETEQLTQIEQQDAPFALNVPTNNLDNIVFPSYEINFDPDCEAKNRFEIQTQKITQFHIETLHNCYIPNVNGNWNHAEAEAVRHLPGSTIKEEEDNFPADINAIVDGYNVVPLYGSDMREPIAKDLSQVKFSKTFCGSKQSKPGSNEVLFHIPFLGVSRTPDFNETKPRLKELKKLTLDEEKENVDYKSNLENILPNASAYAADDAKEKNEATEVNSEQQAIENPSNTTKLKRKSCTKRSFKRKRRASAAARKSEKSVKQAINGVLPTNASDSSDLDNTTETMDQQKRHKRLFYHQELSPLERQSPFLARASLFHISSCSSGGSTADEDETEVSPNARTRLNSTSSTSSSSSSSSSSESEHHTLYLQQEIIQAELAKRAENNNNNLKLENEVLESPELLDKNDDGTVFKQYDDSDLPKENNHMLLSFNNIYNNKSTRAENADQQQQNMNREHENTLLKQQLQNCDDYKKLNSNLNLIKYIDNKNHHVYNLNNINNINNNNNSCSNNYSDTTNVNLCSSSSENLTNPAFVPHLNNNNNNNDHDDVQIRPLKEYQTGLRAVDEDVNDDDGNNCGRLQQFKEWHEVLQLHSYNDELLTVLPYVILE